MTTAAWAFLLSAPFQVWLLWCVFRLADWHRREAAYWGDLAGQAVALEEAGRDTTSLEELLAWAQAHPPTLRERVRGWRSPRMRRTLAAYGAMSRAARP